MCRSDTPCACHTATTSGRCSSAAARSQQARPTWRWAIVAGRAAAWRAAVLLPKTSGSRNAAARRCPPLAGGRKQRTCRAAAAQAPPAGWLAAAPTRGTARSTCGNWGPKYPQQATLVPGAEGALQGAPTCCHGRDGGVGLVMLRVWWHGGIIACLYALHCTAPHRTAKSTLLPLHQRLQTPPSKHARAPVTHGRGGRHDGRQRPQRRRACCRSACGRQGGWGG